MSHKLISFSYILIFLSIKVDRYKEALWCSIMYIQSEKQQWQSRIRQKIFYQIIVIISGYIDRSAMIDDFGAVKYLV